MNYDNSMTSMLTTLHSLLSIAICAESYTAILVDLWSSLDGLGNVKLKQQRVSGKRASPGRPQSRCAIIGPPCDPTEDRRGFAL